MISFENKNEGTWFYAVKDDKESGGICLRVLSIEQYLSIEKITTKVKKKVKKGVAYDEITTDETLASKLRWRDCIVDWNNLQLNGVEVPCDNANKVEMCKSMEFLSWVADCLEELTEKTSALDEARLGNSKGLSNGSVEPTK
ncbi:hypothetical protein LCGC14_0561290 [marine sediment metagenome]|uniref:Uncharacterized protein n=1 Tax=marine sediment metagenome TaxID=412755 RepID=A0A0F9S5J0_9ZZZZ